MHGGLEAFATSAMEPTTNMSNDLLLKELQAIQRKQDVQSDHIERLLGIVTGIQAVLTPQTRPGTTALPSSRATTTLQTDAAFHPWDPTPRRISTPFAPALPLTTPNPLNAFFSQQASPTPACIPFNPPESLHQLKPPHPLLNKTEPLERPTPLPKNGKLTYPISTSSSHPATEEATLSGTANHNTSKLEAHRPDRSLASVSNLYYQTEDANAPLMGVNGDYNTGMYERSSSQLGNVPEEEEYKPGVPQGDHRAAKAKQAVKENVMTVGRLLFGVVLPYEKVLWDVFILVLLLWVCFGSPFVICFDLKANYYKGDKLGYVELVVDLCFVVDMYLNFRTAYIDEKGQLITGRTSIALHYLRGWFVPDLVSILPLDIILFGLSSFTGFFKMLRVMRIGKIMRLVKAYRMLKIIKLPRVLEALELYLNQNVLAMILSMLACLFVVHIAACVFYFMASLDGIHNDTWVQASGLNHSSLARRYLSSVYWAVTTLCTVGYGDIVPRTDKEKFVAIFLMFIGVNMVGYVTSTITSILSVRNTSAARIASKKQVVRDFLKDRSVPKSLALRITEFYHYVACKEVRRDERDIISDLPPKLRSKVLHHLYSDTLQKVPAFKGQHPDFLADLVSNLKLEYYVKGDIVVQQGDHATAMYFVGEGQLEVRSYEIGSEDTWNSKTATEEADLLDYSYSVRGILKAPFYFGQASCMASLPSPATVIATDSCELYSLSRENLMLVLEKWPEVSQVLSSSYTSTLRRMSSLGYGPAEGQPQGHPAMFRRHTINSDELICHISADFPFLQAPRRTRQSVWSNLLNPQQLLSSSPLTLLTDLGSLFKPDEPRHNDSDAHDGNECLMPGGHVRSDQGGVLSKHGMMSSQGTERRRSDSSLLMMSKLLDKTRQHERMGTDGAHAGQHLGTGGGVQVGIHAGPHLGTGGGAQVGAHGSPYLDAACDPYSGHGFPVASSNDDPGQPAGQAGGVDKGFTVAGWPGVARKKRLSDTVVNSSIELSISNPEAFKQHAQQQPDSAAAAPLPNLHPLPRP